MKALTIFAFLLLFTTIGLAGWLYHWTYQSFFLPHYPLVQTPEALAAFQRAVEENHAKPLRPLARLAFSAIMIVGLLVLDLYLFIKVGKSRD